MKIKYLKAYKEFFKSKVRWNILYGGSGSGKSYSIIQKILIRILTEKGHRFLCVRKVSATIKDSIFEQFKEVISEWGISNEFVFNKTDYSITHKLTKNQIICKGLDDPEKLKSITGISSIFIEEATELDQKDIQELDRRLRGKRKSYKQIIVSFNPVSEDHWIRKYFDFDNKANPNEFILKTTYLDNLFVGEEYKIVMEK